MKIIITPLLFFLLLVGVGCSAPKIMTTQDDPTSVIGQYFNNIPTTPVVFNIQKDTFIAPEGGHIQGIQQLDKRHLVISGSSNHKAYFFIAKMKGITSVKRRGIITKMVYINDDFPSMRHNLSLIHI